MNRLMTLQSMLAAVAALSACSPPSIHRITGGSRVNTG